MSINFSDSNSFPFFTAYSSKPRISISFPSPGLTKQSFKDECDINTIMGRYLRTGILPETVQQIEGQFLDVSDVDFRSSMELVADAWSMFNELPSNIRSRFSNDPGEFLAFSSDPKNRSEMGRMGLLRADWDRAEGEVATPPSKPVVEPSNPSSSSSTS